ncbi:hypothetical protein [Bifidobacterium cuniculi]|uniref:Uncharacterized protein n=1 Tax=Bifidobacterium cuniculi TaxID=1688 RepID=A0A087ARQ8_9BIFI|nr:hypothetical protein [Bifidobacterium cuniculi]KFI61458.1 hypothetical protein BCUN_1668 [Bifidobacterium cuniculi]
MNSPLENLPNPWRALQAMVPNPAKRDAELTERISALELELDRSIAQSQWQGIEHDRRIGELSAAVSSLRADQGIRTRRWAGADTACSLVLLVLACAVTVVAVLSACGVMGTARPALRWVAWTLAAVGVALAALLAWARGRMPRTSRMGALFEAAVVMLACSWML